MIASPRILVIGDVMTDIIVRPVGPLARGSDRRASIAFLPGGSAANQAAWLASFGVRTDFVGRVGAADAPSEAVRLKAVGVTPWLAGDAERPTGRLIALIDASGERSFLTDRGANDALQGHDIPDALIAGAAMIHLSGYSFFAPGPRAAVLDVMRRSGDKPISADPASAEFLREAGPRIFSSGRKARRSCSPTTTRRRSSPPRTTPRPNARGSPRSIRLSSSSAARRAARRRRAQCAGAPRRRRSRRSTPPAPATPSSPPSRRAP